MLVHYEKAPSTPYEPILTNDHRGLDDDDAMDLTLEDGRDSEHTISTEGIDDDEELQMLVAAYLRDMHYSSSRQSVTNVVYSVINGGLVAIPFFAGQAGIPLFIALVFGITVVSSYTSVMTISMANERHKRTLEDLAETAFGPKGFMWVSIFQIIFSFTLMCISLLVWADIMSNVFDEGRHHSLSDLPYIARYLLGERRGQVIVGATLVLPMCVLKKSMASLRWTSYVNVLVMPAALLAVLATYMTIRSNNSLSSAASLKEISEPKHQWYAVVLGIVFCFSYNQKVFIIYSGLRRHSNERWKMVVRRAGIIIAALYLTFGILGYLSKFRRDEAMDNFNYFMEDTFSEPSRSVYDISSILIAFCLLLTIPVDCLVATTSFRRLVAKYTKFGLSGGGTSQQSSFRSRTNSRAMDNGIAGGSSDPGSASSGSMNRKRLNSHSAETDSGNGDENAAERGLLGVIWCSIKDFLAGHSSLSDEAQGGFIAAGKGRNKGGDDANNADRHRNNNKSVLRSPGRSAASHISSSKKNNHSSSRDNRGDDSPGRNSNRDSIDSELRYEREIERQWNLAPDSPEKKKVQQKKTAGGVNNNDNKGAGKLPTTGRGSESTGTRNNKNNTTATKRGSTGTIGSSRRSDSTGHLSGGALSGWDFNILAEEEVEDEEVDNDGEEEDGGDKVEDLVEVLSCGLGGRSGGTGSLLGGTSGGASTAYSSGNYNTSHSQSHNYSGNQSARSRSQGHLSGSGSGKNSSGDAVAIAPRSFGEFAKGSASEQQRIEQQLREQQQQQLERQKQLEKQQQHRGSLAASESTEGGTYYTDETGEYDEEDGTSDGTMSNRNSRSASKQSNNSGHSSHELKEGASVTAPPSVGIRRAVSDGAGSTGSDEALLKETKNCISFNNNNVSAVAPHSPCSTASNGDTGDVFNNSFNRGSRMSSVARDTRDQAYFLGSGGMNGEEESQLSCCSSMVRAVMRCCCCPVSLTAPEMRSALVMWLLCFGACFFIKHWLYLASTVGTMSTTMLVFVFPSMLYFRLGLTSDYQEMPIICDSILPNRLYMGLTQLAGLGLLVLNVGTVICLIVNEEHIVNNQS